MARDGYDTYYAEKIWQRIPAVHRRLDGEGERPGALRALVEVVAGQAAELRRGQDRLWDDLFIDTADDWAVPYLGDLVGTRLVSALNRRGRRVDVAKTLYYRRRKGTKAVLEELASDIAGWDCAVVEGFRRLGRVRHSLDLGADASSSSGTGRISGAGAATFSGTPAGGTARLSRPRIARLTGSAFDETAHTPDFRAPGRSSAVGADAGAGSGRGRYGIDRLVFHLFRLPAVPLAGVTPRAVAGEAEGNVDGPGEGTFGYTFDPSGRDVPLFAPRRRDPRLGWEWAGWTGAREWEIAAPIPCRLLGHAEYEIDEALILALAQAHALSPESTSQLRRLRGVRYASRRRLARALSSLPAGDTFLAAPFLLDLTAGALVPDCGKAALLAAGGASAAEAAAAVEEAPGQAVPAESVSAGNLAAWGRTWEPADLLERAVIDPERGRFLLVGDDSQPGSSVSFHYGFAGEIGAGGWERRRVEGAVPIFRHQGGGAIPAAELANDGLTQIDDSATYTPLPNKAAVRDLTLQAANHQRPYLVVGGESGGDWSLATGPHQDSRLTLDGLWLGSQGPSNVPAALVLRGDYERVTLRSMTLDPGGPRRIGETSAPDDLPPVELVVEGYVEELVIDRSVLAAVRVRSGGVVERLAARDSIFQALSDGIPGGGGPESPALALPATRVELRRVTVMGGAEVLRLHADDCLFTGAVEVTDTQEGCFRFSAAPAGSRLPRPYEAHPLSGAESLFTSRRFGDPGYAQLSRHAPPAVALGGEGGTEMGAWAGLGNPIKLRSLRAKVEELAPFGRVPVFVLET